MRREVVFPLEELRHICPTFPHCGTQVMLTLAQYEPPVPGVAKRRMAFGARAVPGL